MQDVDLVEGQLVEVALDVRNPEEVARDVQHGPPPGVAGIVQDAPAGDHPGTGAAGGLDGGREQLAQGLGSVEHPGGRIGSEQHLRGCDLQGVALVADGRVAPVQLQDDRARPPASAGDDRNREPRPPAQEGRQPLGGRRCRASGRRLDHRAHLEAEVAGRVGLGRHRRRDHVGHRDGHEAGLRGDGRDGGAGAQDCAGTEQEGHGGGVSRRRPAGPLGSQDGSQGGGHRAEEAAAASTGAAATPRRIEPPGDGTTFILV